MGPLSSAFGPPPSKGGEKSPRRLLFTADDFGLSPALNLAVVLAHQRGLLGNASLMPRGAAAAQALWLARSCPGLCVGLHLTLIQGRPVLPAALLPGLVDGRGRFPEPPFLTGWRYFWQPRLLGEIAAEMRAQIEALLEAGLRIWHLNGHLNLHLHPRILPLAVELAREYGIPALRLAREDWPVTLAVSPRPALSIPLLGLTFALLARRARRLAEAAGLLVNDHLFGLTTPGALTEAFLLALVPRLKPGITEICLHPAAWSDPGLPHPSQRYDHQGEFRALLSLRLAKVLESQEIEVTTFRALALAKRTRKEKFSS